MPSNNKFRTKARSKPRHLKKQIGLASYLLAILFLGGTVAFLLNQYTKVEIGMPTSGEIVILADPNYGNGKSVDLCHRPTCLSSGRYRAIHHIPHRERRKLFRVLKEQYFRALPEVVWYYTKYNNQYGWVPRYLTDRKKGGFVRQLVVRAPQSGAPLCPRPECPINRKHARVPNGTRLVATEVVYRHYRRNQRAKAWLRVRYQGAVGWLNISDTNLNTPGPHYRAPAWKTS